MHALNGAAAFNGFALVTCTGDTVLVVILTVFVSLKPNAWHGQEMAFRSRVCNARLPSRVFHRADVALAVTVRTADNVDDSELTFTVFLCERQTQRRRAPHPCSGPSQVSTVLASRSAGGGCEYWPT